MLFAFMGKKTKMIEMRKINPFVHWWMAPNLPKEHIYIPLEKRPKGLYQKLRLYLRKWIVHPIKRRMAKYYLLFLQRYFGIIVIAITGSAGKTTTKEMLASILRLKGKTVASYKNIDPVYNIPMTILKCRPGTRYLVLELGVEYPGEMEFYCWLVKPNIGIITNIYPTHIQFFGSIKGVANEKENLIRHLPKSGFAILNRDNKYLRNFANKVKVKVIWYGKGCEISAENSALTSNMRTRFVLVIKESKINIHLPMIGNQFVENALAAASAARVLGINLKQIKKGLENYEKPEHRMNVIKLRSGALLVDDSYNNNPEAAKKSLRTFKEIAGNKETIVVFGDMLELGNFEKEYHRQLGELISSLGFNFLIGVGELSKNTVEIAGKKLKKNRLFWVGSEGEVDAILKPLLKKHRAVLVKGSRSIGLDNLVS